jgi:hypothetical protein
MHYHVEDTGSFDDSCADNKAEIDQAETDSAKNSSIGSAMQ